MAGDFVKSANPRQNPANIAISSLFSFAVKTAKNKVQTPNIVSIESTNAIRSKKNAIGQTAHKRQAINETLLLLNNS